MRVSRHADRRVRERIGIPRSAVKKMAAKARAEGVSRLDTHGSLRRYLDALYHYNEQADSIVVYNEKVWIFSGATLITVLDLHQRYKNRANGMQKKAREES